MSSVNPKQTSDQDRAIGSRVAALRNLRGLSQTTVASSLGISFQQVQKYESGRNRIGAGRLHEIAALLGVPVAALFAEEDTLAAEDAETLSLFKVEGVPALLRAYASIDDDRMRSDVLAIVRTASRLAAARKASA